MAGNFDFDVIVVGSGFGGSVAALRATEKGYRVCVLESGRRWPDAEIPTTSWRPTSIRRRGCSAWCGFRTWTPSWTG